MLRWLDDCGDHYTTSQVLKRWNVADWNTLSTVSGRCGGNGFSALPFATHQAGFHKTFDSQDTWIVGFAHQARDSVGVERQMLLRLFDTTVCQMEYRVESDGTIGVYRGGTSEGNIVLNVTAGATFLAKSVAALQANNWYYLEFKTVIHNTNGSYEVRLNGTNILSATGVDTYVSGNVSANVVRICGGRTFAVPLIADYFDDMYIADGQTSSWSGNGRLADFAGDLQVNVLRANANGSNQQFTPLGGGNHFAEIDETTADSDTSYLESSTVNFEEFNAYEDVPAGKTVVGLQLECFGNKQDAGARGVRLGFRTGGTNYYSNVAADEHFPSALDYRYFIQPSDKNPATGSAWTRSEVNAGEYGVKITT